MPPFFRLIDYQGRTVEKYRKRRSMGENDIGMITRIIYKLAGIEDRVHELPTARVYGSVGQNPFNKLQT